MSQSFRAVKEVWGDHSSNFVDSDALCGILESFAEEIDSGFSVDTHGDLTVVWISDGKGFLNFLDAQSATKLKQLFTPSFADDYGADPTDVEALLDNMHGLAKSWRGMIDTDGSIRFYID